MGISRRQVLRAIGVASAASVLPIKLLGRAVQSSRAMRIIEISPVMFRLTVAEMTEFSNSRAQPPSRATVQKLNDLTGQRVNTSGFLAEGLGGRTLFEANGEPKPQTLQSGDLKIEISNNPLTLNVFGKESRAVQKVVVNPDGVTFSAGEGPLLGLGEGGPQFDRRGDLDLMISGSGGYHLQSHGSRVPIPFLIGSSGWAIFFHQPLGTFDLKNSECKFLPTEPPALLDLFVVISKDPSVIMAEYARLTGHPELPPLWSFGYLQSHRTLGDRASVLAEAKTFREKKLPCDALIYLGTGFCPNGWNVRNGSFEWNSKVFPDPPAMIAEFHEDHFKVIPHVVIEAKTLRGTARDKFDPSRPNPEKAASYWNDHRPDFSMGIDGWWPDEGDWLDMPARLVRNRLYWEGPQIDRPNERPFALHRNGAPGMQRYASFLWSGDVYSRWETLRNQVSIGINTGLSGIPYWGTDIGGFVPTPEFTAELYLRWFQFGAFCPLFRCHGRNWTLRLPWGWDTGDPGPQEVRDYKGSGLPDPSQLHNTAVEPICRKYLELRYRLMPYLYSVVREGTKTGLPIMRALWLHYPNDPRAVACGDVYLWGRDILVAPVVEKGATSHTLYLPPGTWYDFWTGETVEGGREVTRTVDLATMPLYVRAGAIIPMGPIKQYTAEPVNGPLELHVYPGVDGSFLVYEDDGSSFEFRKGRWTGIVATWDDSKRTLDLRLAKGSRMVGEKFLEVYVVGQIVARVRFDGRPVLVQSERIRIAPGVA